MLQSEEKLIDALFPNLPGGQIQKWVSQEWSAVYRGAPQKCLGANEVETREIIRLQQSMYEDYRALREKEITHSKRELVYLKSLLRTRVDQIRQQANSMALQLAPLPANSNAWSPPLVPFAQRRFLPVSCEMIDTNLERLTKNIWELAGLRIEYSPRIQDRGLSFFPPLNLSVRNMSAEFWLDWLCKIENFKCEYKDVKVLIDLAQP